MMEDLKVVICDAGRMGGEDGGLTGWKGFGYWGNGRLAVRMACQ